MDQNNIQNNLRNIIRWEHYEYISTEDIHYNNNFDESNGDVNCNELVFDSPELYIPTKMGLAPTEFYKVDFSNISFWNAYTNFSITKKIANTIETIDGIESLEVNGRYRFRIGIAPLFNDGDVLKSIQDVLQCNPPSHSNRIPEEIKPKVNKLTKVLWTKYIFWFIRIDQNNKIFNYGTNNKIDFLEKLNVEKSKVGTIMMFDGTTFEKLRI